MRFIVCDVLSGHVIVMRFVSRVSLRVCHMISSRPAHPKMRKMSVLQLLVLSVFLASPSLAAVPGDEVKGLPGWEGALPTTQYSGYIEIDSAKQSYLHYWYLS